MRELLHRIRLPLLFAVLVLVSVISMTADRAPLRAEGRDHSWWGGWLLELAAPVQKALGLPVRVVSDVWSRYVALVDLAAENERLRGRVGELEEERLQYREALVASGHLDQIAEMRQGSDVPLLPALVVGQDLVPWFRSVLVDRGSSRRVRSGMPVVANRGLVGVVTATTPHAARVMLLLDRRSAADGMIQRSRARGIVRGTGERQLEFVFAVRGDDVRVGDEVITSGVGGVHPKGLRMGEVVAVRNEESRLVHTAIVRPAVDFGRLEQVFVVLHRAATMDLLYGGEGDLPSEGLASREPGAP
jgi:rod shape-determining protein MreC